MEIKIRKATLKDLSVIDKIYVEGSIDEGKLQFPRTSRKKLLSDLEKHKRSRLIGWRKDFTFSNNLWLVAEVEGIVVGFGNAEVSKNFDKLEGFISMIYISSEFRKKGIGRRLLKEFVSGLRKKKVNSIDAGFYVANKPSIKMCGAFGFEPLSLKMRLKKC